MVSAEEPAREAALAEIGRLARRRWLLSLGIFAVASRVIGPIVGSHAGQRHHGGGVSAIAVAIGVIVSGVIFFALFGRRAWGGKGLYAPHLVAGRPARQRRAVTAAVRRGLPSHDALLRAIEQATARRACAEGNKNLVLLAAFALLELGYGPLVGHTSAGRAFFIASGVFLAVVFALQLRTMEGAKQYVRRAARDR